MRTRRRVSWTYSGHIPPVRPDGSPNIRAFGPQDLDVVFQPIVRANNGRVLAQEALVRCKHPIYESPAALFEQASAQRCCGHLGHVIRRVAFDRCPDSALFVNIHPDELSSRWLVRPDDSMGFHGHDVYLEITETAAFTHFDLCMDVLKEVCDRTGAHLVVDDFGAGHSNLQRVLDLRPSIVKLDGALVRGLDTDVRRQRLVRHIVDLCTDLGAEIVAECVETVDELLAVRDAGAKYVQGFLLARPAYPVPQIDWPLKPSRPPAARRIPSTRPPPRRSQAPRARASQPPRRSGKGKVASARTSKRSGRR